LAEKYFLESLKIQESDYAYQHLGICYAKQENYQKAYDAFKKMVYSSNDLQTKANFACCCNNLKKYDESIVVLEKCLQINRQQTISWGLLEIAYNEKGVQLAMKKKFSLALSLFRSALEINPDFKSAFSNIIEINRVLNLQKTK
jgi:tetratricopeptide (TPR) repeat protein